MNVLFVCTGNTCRSPLAEALARVEARRRGLGLTVGSAGTFASAGASASIHAVRVGGTRGADLSGHRSQRLDHEQLAKADLAVGMAPSHVEAIRHLDPGVRTALATEFLPPDDSRRGTAIPDPIGGDVQVYEDVAVVLDECIAGLLDRMREVR